MANDRSQHWFFPINGLSDDNKSNSVDISVSHSKGGINYATYNREPAGYWVSVNACDVRPDGSVAFTMFTGIGRKFFVAKGERFNAKKLQALAAALRPLTGDLAQALVRRDYDAMRAIIHGVGAVVFPSEQAVA
jgi:hypothetical protein